MTGEIRCGTCYASIPPAAWNQGSDSRCEGCGTDVMAWVFPAIHTNLRGASAEALLEASEAACFYHSESRAHVVCDHCGRFLCALCDLEIGSRHLCPVCFQSPDAQADVANIEPRRVMYDTVALTLATVPALIISPTIVTAPMALFLSLWWWRKPTSIVGRSKIRLVLAVLFALAEIGLWIFVVYAIVASSSSTKPPE